MDITVKKLPQAEVEMHIVLSCDEWKGELNHAAEHVAGEVNVPDFVRARLHGKSWSNVMARASSCMKRRSTRCRMPMPRR